MVYTITRFCKLAMICVVLFCSFIPNYTVKFKKDISEVFHVDYMPTLINDILDDESIDDIIYFSTAVLNKGKKIAFTQSINTRGSSDEVFTTKFLETDKPSYDLLRDLRLNSISILGAAMFAGNVELIEKIVSKTFFSSETQQKYSKYIVSVNVNNSIGFSNLHAFTAEITPLQLAVLIGDREIIELLLQYGAKPTVLTVHGNLTEKTETNFAFEDLINKNYQDIFARSANKSPNSTDQRSSEDREKMLSLIKNGPKLSAKKEEKKLEQKKFETRSIGIQTDLVQEEKESVEPKKEETKKTTKSTSTQTEQISNKEEPKAMSDLAASLKSLSGSFVMGLVTPQSDSNYFIPRLFFGGAAMGNVFIVTKKLQDKTQSMYLIAGAALAYTAGLLTNTLLMKRLPKRLPRLQTTFACYPRLSNAARWVTGLGVTGLLSWQNLAFTK